MRFTAALLLFRAIDGFQLQPLMTSVRTSTAPLSANIDTSSDAESTRRDFFQYVAGSTVSAIATVEGLTTGFSAPSAVTAATAVPVQSAAFKLPPMGLGAWAWGDSLFWGCKYDLSCYSRLRVWTKMRCSSFTKSDVFHSRILCWKTTQRTTKNCEKSSITRSKTASLQRLSSIQQKSMVSDGRKI